MTIEKRTNLGANTNIIRNIRVSSTLTVTIDKKHTKTNIIIDNQQTRKNKIKYEQRDENEVRAFRK